MKFSSSHSINWNGDVDAVINAVELWAFDNDFHVDSHLSGRIRISRCRIKFAFFAIFPDALDFPIDLTVKIPQSSRQALELVVKANFIDMVFVSRGEFRKIEVLAKNLAYAIAAALQAAQTEVHSHTDYGHPSMHVTDETSVSLAELGFNGERPNWTDIEARYRELVLQYHPDRYANITLPPEMLEAAAKRFNRIVAAYKYLKESR